MYVFFNNSMLDHQRFVWITQQLGGSSAGKTPDFSLAAATEQWLNNAPCYIPSCTLLLVKT